MKKVVILALDNVLAASVMGPLDVFCQTGATWNYIQGEVPVSYFDVTVVTKDGRPAGNGNRAGIQPNCAMDEIGSTDLILVSSFSDERTVDTSGDAIEWLTYHYSQGSTLAGICAGAYILAETGLLDGKTATTHWGFAKDFRQRYPGVKLEPEKIITDEGRLLCSGGCTSYLDLSMYLVERYCGRQVALESAKAMLHDLGRSSQAPYQSLGFAGNHNDAKIRSVQEWLEANYNRPVNIKALAAQFGLSRRVLERRFKAATGDTPLIFLQRVRVAAAKGMLESNAGTFSEIAFKVGYEDTGFFRKLFKKHTTLGPKEYKARFCRV